MSDPLPYNCTRSKFFVGRWLSAEILAMAATAQPEHALGIPQRMSPEEAKWADVQATAEDVQRIRAERLARKAAAYAKRQPKTASRSVG